jgi:L-idonate 5-dehydrogenase
MTNTLTATLYGAEDLRLVETTLPPLAEGMVRVRFRAGGICGSDMHYFLHGANGDFVVREPLVLGHELAGEVVEVNAPGTDIAPGDRLAVNPSRWCETCPRCHEGRHNLCENVYFMGSASKFPHMQGGFAALFDAIPAQCVKVPGHVPMEAAALAEPLAVCLHAVARAGDMRARRTIIFGAGPIGLLTLKAARLAGAGELTVADIAPAPLAFATRLGADHVADMSGGADALTALTPSGPFDVAFEASGAPAALASAIKAVRRGGIIVQLGTLPAGDIPMAANAVMAKEIDLRGTMRFGREFDEAVRLISDGGVDVLDIVTALRPLADAPGAIRLALDRSQSMKVVLTAN